MAEKRQRLLIFALTSQAYAVAGEQVKVVTFMSLLVEPPGCPPVLRGFLMMDGTPVPVLDLRRLFGLPDVPAGLYTPLVVLRSGPLALLVDELLDHVAVKASDWSALGPHRVVNDCVQAEVSWCGRSVHVLDVQRLLLEEERQRVQELQELERRRLQALS